MAIEAITVPMTKRFGWGFKKKQKGEKGRRPLRVVLLKLVLWKL